MNVFPDFGSLAGIDSLKTAIGALLAFGLIVAVLMMIPSAIIRAIASSHDNSANASKARIGLLVGLSPAALAGGGAA
ncbi:DUF6112 family protein [Propionibacterium freudenreichii]|uniref:DUF6112 family protein n=1 Tax=Propionibacterium freudenreichii TaxID=1744 RepID=UPI0005A5C763|nr:DUF6112 family protein [Propionibacterium freudenreichii]CEI30602.1 Protein of unknown function [Propionibacterium freudenreichii]